MLPKAIVLASSLVLVHFVQPITSCMPPSNGTGGDDGMTWGTDQPADPATLGYFINHFSLNVKNLTASLDFYYNVFGVRHIFTQKASEHLQIAYMGHAQGGRNGTGYQTTKEINREKNDNAGLIEMIFLDVPERQDLPSSSVESNTFGHIGVIVPDPEAAQKRFEALGLNILKNYGADTPNQGPIAVANGFPPAAWEQISEAEKQQIQETLNFINMRFIYLEDPDGNIIEVQPQY